MPALAGSAVWLTCEDCGSGDNPFNGEGTTGGVFYLSALER